MEVQKFRRKSDVCDHFIDLKSTALKKSNLSVDKYNVNKLASANDDRLLQNVAQFPYDVVIVDVSEST